MSKSLRAALAASAVSSALAVSVLAPAPADAQTTKVVSTTKVTVYGYYFSGSELNTVSFLGRVRPAKQKEICRKNRTVKFTDGDGSPLYATAKSDGAGVWKATFNPDAVEGSEPVFRAKVTRKVIRKKGLTIVCKGASTLYAVGGGPA